MQDEANQAGVGEDRGLEGGRETTQNYKKWLVQRRWKDSAVAAQGRKMTAQLVLRCVIMRRFIH